LATVILINQAQMGHGDADLGRRILANFLRKISSIQDLEAICLYNSGVLLAATDSPVATELTLLRENGVEVMACGTCVEHYGVGNRLISKKPVSMDDIITAMRQADKVISL
jgi:sulfur relay (sulfurtransferase) complex TusBCD TusD component (DsrE family)